MLRWVLIFALFLISTCSNAGVVIANASLQLPKAMAVEDLRDIFQLRKVYADNGVKYQVFLLDRDSLVTRQFFIEILGVSPTTYFYTLDIVTSTGKSNLPIMVSSESKMVSAVLSNPGGVGYLRSADFVGDSTSVVFVTIK